MERLLDQAEVAKGFGIAERTLEAWRYRRTGPRYVRVGRRVRYRPRDVERWLDQQGQEASDRAS